MSKDSPQSARRKAVAAALAEANAKTGLLGLEVVAESADPPRMYCAATLHRGFCPKPTRCECSRDGEPGMATEGDRLMASERETPVNDADREAVMAFLRRVEAMDVALLGAVACCAVHAYARRLKSVDLIEHARQTEAYPHGK